MLSMLADLQLLNAIYSLMPHRSPILKVSRPIAACQRCRNAKIKCDDQVPCTACKRAGKEDVCRSANDLFAQGRERSYVAALESRIEELEKKIANAKARKACAANIDEPFQKSLSATADPNSSGPRSSRAAREKEALDIDDLVGDFGLLAVSATARDFYGFTNTVSYARLVVATSVREPLPERPASTLPARNEAMILVDYFLEHVYVLLPLFDKVTFQFSVEAVFTLGYRVATAFDIWCVRMVLAISSALHSKERGDREYTEAVGHLIGALAQAEQVLHPGSIQSIQAMILLILYSMLDPRHLDSWNLVGMTSRIMVDLGIHQDPPKYPPMPKAKLELRRRVFWCLYTLDRSTSIVQTKTFSFSDNSANVAFPFAKRASITSNSFPRIGSWLESPNAALQLFRLRQMQSEWYTILFQSGKSAWKDPYKYIWQTYHALSAWWKDVDQSTTSMTKTFFELELNYSYVYILSPSPRVPITSDYAQRLLFEHCIIYADIFIRAITRHSRMESLTISFYDMMRAHMTGRQLVDILTRNRDKILNDSVVPATDVPILPTASETSLASPTSPPPPLPPPPRISYRRSSASRSDFSGPYDSVEENSCTRAISALDNFTATLTALGARFGYLSWRDNFRQSCALLLEQLRERAVVSEAAGASFASANASVNASANANANTSMNANTNMVANIWDMSTLVPNPQASYHYPAGSGMGYAGGGGGGSGSAAGYALSVGQQQQYPPPNNAGSRSGSFSGRRGSNNSSVAGPAGTAGATARSSNEFGWDTSMQRGNNYLHP